MVAVFIALMFAPLSFAESGVQALSPELRALLNKEMQALQSGMQKIIPAYVTGDLAEVAHIAGKMKNSYILKQQITKAQQQELKTKLSHGFLRSDQEFHEYAGKLQHVAEEKHGELVVFYYSKLMESCVSCHSRFASYRFKGFKGKRHKKGHHH